MKRPLRFLAPLVLLAGLAPMTGPLAGSAADPGPGATPTGTTSATGTPTVTGTATPTGTASPTGTGTPTGTPTATSGPGGGPSGPGEPPDPPFSAVMAGALTGAATTDRSLGPALSGVVVDPADGTVPWRHRDTTPRMPASVQKLVTAFTVLESMPASATLTTSTCRSAARPATVYLRGGGDPSLSAARIRQLAARTASALGRRAGRVQVVVDGSLFPAPTAAPGWRPAYLASDVQLVRGLTVAGYRGKDGRTAAGAALVKALARAGVRAVVAGAARAPSRCTTLATTASAPVGTLVADMLQRSDNDYAEFLLRHAALARGAQPSWSGALGNQLQLLRQAGVPTAGLATFDGSGLSRADRVQVATIAQVLVLLRRDPGHAAIVFGSGGLPSAGLTGTLQGRFTAPAQRCARGLVRAKTGTLADAVALAGVARGRDGRPRVFVFLDNGVRRTDSVRSALDGLATTVVGCAGA